MSLEEALVVRDAVFAIYEAKEVILLATGTPGGVYLALVLAFVGSHYSEPQCDLSQTRQFGDVPGHVDTALTMREFTCLDE